MFKSIKEIAVPLEKSLRTDLMKELAQFEALMKQGDSVESDEEAGAFQLSIKILSSGRRVYCPHRQNPSRNRKTHVRSLLIH